MQNETLDLATYSQAGAQYGFGMLWMALFQYPMMTVIQEMSGRIGLITGSGLNTVIKRKYSKKVVLPLTSLLLIANTINIGADIGAMAASVRLVFPELPIIVVTLCFTVFIVVSQILVPYNKYVKKCLADHGINATVIATIHGIGGNNGTLIDKIGRYYDLAVNGFDKLMSLHCTSYGQYSNQTECRTYFTNGTLTSVNRYSLREWSHNNIDKVNFHNDSKTFEMFVDEVNIQDKHNKVNGPILVVPIVAYHSIDNNKTRDSTDVTLFDREMKYLYDTTVLRY